MKETQRGFRLLLESQQPAMQSSGFALVEMCAILMVVVLFSCTLIPALTRTGANIRGVQCLNNLRQQGEAWLMYAEDNSGQLVYNHDGGNAGKAAGSEAWVAGWLDFSSSSDNTNSAMLINHERFLFGAYLGPYLKSPRPFKCPADKSTISIAGQRMSRVRSISMSNRVGQGSRPWLGFSAYWMYSKLSEISKPSPSSIFVLLEENENSINDGWFATDSDTAWQLIDYPAAYHNGGAGFSFADGHSEIHRWRDARTMPILKPGQLLPLNVSLPGDPDVQWLQQHAAARR